jgi:hypothetical protein
MTDKHQAAFASAGAGGAVTDLPITLSRAQSEITALRAELSEARRRRDEWRAKAEGYDAVRKALREKVGDPWPPSLSRALWAGIAADEKKRADDAEAENTRLRGLLEEARKGLAASIEYMAFNATDISEPYPLDRARAILAKLENAP